MKVILTGRDPRDIYISVYYRTRNPDGGISRPRFTPKSLANSLNKEFKKQLEMYKTMRCLTVRYEDFCSDITVMNDILLFSECKIDNHGDIGGFNKNNPQRENENKLHGGEITSKRVARWKNENDKEIIKSAEPVFSLMPEYTEFWEYD